MFCSSVGDIIMGVEINSSKNGNPHGYLTLEKEIKKLTSDINVATDTKFSDKVHSLAHTLASKYGSEDRLVKEVMNMYSSGGFFNKLFKTDDYLRYEALKVYKLK